MAGSWPDLPNPRIEFDRDGTRVYTIVGTTVTEVTGTPLTQMNDESSGSQWRPSVNNWMVMFVFPELRDITHLFIDCWSAGQTSKVEWSNDSTTGLDGTWTTAAAAFTVDGANLTEQRYRTDITAIAGLTGVKMVRFSGAGWALNSLHMYGVASAGQNLNRLRFWHPTLDQPLSQTPALLDWGNVAQGTSDVRQFRVKNDSPSLTAGGVTVFMQALTEASPTQVSQHTLSSDNVNFVASASPGLSLGTLAAQAISGVLYLKRTTLSSAQLSLWRQRLVAAASTWS